MKEENGKNCLDPKVTLELVHCILRDAVATGAIDLSSLNDQQAARQIDGFLRRVSVDVDHVDYTDSLLAAATDCNRRGSEEVTILLYATWVEHVINWAVETSALRRGLSRREIGDLLRTVNWEGKTTWIATLLDLPHIHPTHLKVLKRLSEYRNSFVHYKWSAGKNQDEREDQGKKLLSAIPPTVRYLRTYLTRSRMRGQDGRLKRLLRESDRAFRAG
jgi:hypothetical protein